MSRAHSSLSLSAEEVTSVLKLFPKGLVAVDLETTGLSPLVDKIIEIAAVKVTADGVVSHYHTLINPLIEIPDFTIQFHGLTNSDLKNAPTIKKPLREFWEFVGRYPMIGHNSTWDLGYLIKSCHDFQLEFPPLDIYDSCRLARALLKRSENPPKNYRLSTLCEYWNIPLNHHVAMEDTLACIKIVAELGKHDVNFKTPLDKSFIFRLSSFDRNECFNFSTRLNGLRDLVISKQLVRLHYKGKGHQGPVRPVRPIGLMPMPMGPVLFAECLLTGLNRSFLLKKIKSYSSLEACYWNPQSQTLTEVQLDQ